MRTLKPTKSKVLFLMSQTNLKKKHKENLEIKKENQIINKTFFFFVINKQFIRPLISMPNNIS